MTTYGQGESSMRPQQVCTAHSNHGGPKNRRCFWARKCVTIPTAAVQWDPT